MRLFDECSYLIQLLLWLFNHVLNGQNWLVIHSAVHTLPLVYQSYHEAVILSEGLVLIVDFVKDLPFEALVLVS